MARQESDKEDLIRDATALIERTEFVLTDDDAVLTVGFFRDGRMVVYFDQDPFYQFDVKGRLRRAFENGILFRSQGTTLSRMTRTRTDESDANRQVVLKRTNLNSESLSTFRERMCERLRGLQDAIASGKIEILRSVTEDGGLPKGTSAMLSNILQQKSGFLADSPAGR